MKDKIIEWLEKSGYPLELFATQKLLENGFHCDKSDLYLDPDTNKYREIDLVGSLWEYIRDDISLTLKIIIECKKSEKPLIVLNSQKEKRSLLHEIFAYKSVDKSITPIALKYLQYSSEVNGKLLIKNFGEFAKKKYIHYSLVQAFATTDINMYQGIMSLTKAEQYHFEEFEQLFIAIQKDNFYKGNDKNVYEIILPIILVEAPLYTVKLGTRGNIYIEETDWEILNIGTSPSIGPNDRSIISVVKKGYFNSFLIHCKKGYNFFMSDLFHNYKPKPNQRLSPTASSNRS